MDLIVDTVQHIGYAAGPLEVHTRIYANDTHRVIILAQLDTRNKGTILRAAAEHVAKEITNTFLADEPLGQTIWVLATEDSNWNDQELGLRTALQCVVFERSREPGEMLQDHWSHSQSMFIETDALEEAIGGATIIWYPWKHYTRSLVEQYRRSKGVPVTVIEDDRNLKPYVRALLTLDSLTLKDKSDQESIHHGQQALLNVLKLQTAGTFNVSKELLEDRPEDQTVVKEKTYELPEQIKNRVDDCAAWEEQATFDKNYEEHCKLLSIQEKFDPHSDDPDEDIYQALEQAISASATMLYYLDPDRGNKVSSHEHREILPRALSLNNHGIWDRKYLNTITFVDQDLRKEPDPLDRTTTHDARWLASKLWTKPGHTRFGFDSHSNLIVAIENQFGITDCAIMWPQHWQGPELTTSMKICADGAVGDRPAYVTHAEVLVGLVPRTREVQWNFGYGGGGPGTLATDLSTFFENQGILASPKTIGELTSSGSDEIFELPLSLFRKK